jgi:hypothetical protein
MTIPPHIAKAAEDAAEKHMHEYFSRNNLPGPGSTHNQIFQAGAQWLYSHLTAQAEGEFDADAADREFQSGTHTYLDFLPQALWRIACKWQYSKDQALIAGLREKFIAQQIETVKMFEQLEAERARVIDWKDKCEQLHEKNAEQAAELKAASTFIEMQKIEIERLKEQTEFLKRPAGQAISIHFVEQERNAAKEKLERLTSALERIIGMCTYDGKVIEKHGIPAVVSCARQALEEQK